MFSWRLLGVKTSLSLCIVDLKWQSQICLLVFVWHNILLVCVFCSVLISLRLAESWSLPIYSFQRKRERGSSACLAWSLMKLIQTWKICLQSGIFCPALAASRSIRPKTEVSTELLKGSLFLLGSLIDYFTAGKGDEPTLFFFPPQLASAMCFSSYSDRNSLSKCDLLIRHAQPLLT